MILSKAIEILSNEIDNITLSSDVDLPSALRLGIEALKRVDNDRVGLHVNEITLLPGETGSIWQASNDQH